MTKHWKYVAAVAAVVSLPLVALAQTRVTVDLSKPINLLTDTSVGFPAAMFTGDNFNLAGAGYLKTAGVTTPRYPGNHGAADLYHWSTKKVTPYKGSAAPYFTDNSNFGNFAQLAERLGNALVVVNYGTNADGTGGGEPAEAAAWVAYANGVPEDQKELGKDAAGNDWHTVGFWATLRVQEPQANDDGYNFLRIHHIQPFGIKLWQVGDQLFNNGYFGGEHTGNPDLHGAIPAGLKDFGKLKKDPKLSAAAYAERMQVFAKAMKAVDPSIQIGVGMATPADGEKTYTDWNRTVLKGACGSIDFVSLDWQTGNPAPPDWKTLDETNLFPDTKTQIGAMIAGMLDDYKGTCPAGHTPRIALSSANIITWPKFDHPAVKALWVADTYAILAESGFLNFDWPDAYSDDMMSADRKKFGPVFYGLQMLHVVAHNPGDAFLDARSSSPEVTVHAIRRRDGIFGLMLVNLDPKAPATVKVSLKGGSVGTTGKRFDYGQAQQVQGTGLAASPMTTTGDEFTVTVPAYSVTDLLLPLAK
jgi:hypothetical protein